MMRSADYQGGDDRNREFCEGILVDDLDFGTRDTPATASVTMIIRRLAFGDYVEGETKTVYNRDANYNRLAGQHILMIRINGELRPL